MISHWLSRINCLLFGLALLFGLGGIFFWISRSSEIECGIAPLKECILPKGSFELADHAYEKIGESLLALEQVPPTMQLPDLRQHLIYYGKNGRPDAQSKNTVLHFSLNGNKSIVSSSPNEKLYLFFDRKSHPAKYSFSPQNEKTSLWIEAVPTENDVQINVAMENDKGEKIIEPEAFAHFNLTEKEFIRYAGSNWELGSFRVDATLLARQKARWYGPDRFLEKHGGDDYQHIVGKQRIDFAESDDLYSVFVKPGDCLIWDRNRWKVVMPGEESLGYPLLLVKKIDDRLMSFELWDVEGKGRIILNLLKSSEPWTVQNTQALQHMFKFVGAKTRSQCVFEINRERMVLKPSDWLLLTPKGWKKLISEEEIDQYVKRKTYGTLFVFDGISRKEGKQIMLGTLYSPSRHDCQSVELALQVKKPSVSKDIKEVKESKMDEEDEEEEDDDDEIPPNRQGDVMRPSPVQNSLQNKVN